MEVLKFIYRNLDHFRHQFISIFIVALLDGLAIFLIPVTLAEFTKSSFTEQDFSNLLLIIVGLYVASLGFQWVLRKWGEALGPQFGDHLRLKYFKALEKLPIKDLVHHHSGYLSAIINKVSDGLARIVYEFFWSFAKSISSVILFFYFTARESFGIAIINLCILVVFITVSTFLARKIVVIVDELNKKRASLLESYADFMANILTVKRLSIYHFVESKLFRKTDEHTDKIEEYFNFQANRWFFLHTLFGIAFISTIAFLLLQVSRGHMSPAILILFIAAYSTIRSSIERLSENIKSLLEMKAYITDLDTIISPNTPEAKGRAVDGWKEIRFRNVDFQYQGTSKRIRVPNFHIKKGETLCVIGESGEGKSTFLNLFTNFLKPDKGERHVDGLSYKKLSQDFFQTHVTVISQETELFNISLRENITLGQDISDEAILAIFEQLSLLPWLQNLEEGLDTVIGEKGVKLSAGQKQRVNLIRGLLLDRDIILLDEPTSHLDAATEEEVIKFMAEYLTRKTAIIVTHREKIRRLCDRCYSMKHGELLEIT